MSITSQTIKEQTVVTLHLTNLSNVDEANADAHAKLGALLQSFAGRAAFTGGTVAILNDSAINVSVDLRPNTEEAKASAALRKAFFTS